MKTNRLLYESPLLRAIATSIERGFAASADGSLPSWEDDGEF